MAKIVGFLFCVAGIVMSAFSVRVGAAGFSAMYGFSGTDIVIPYALLGIAAILCPATTACFAATVTVYAAGWPWWQAALVFVWWIALLAYWRFRMPHGEGRRNLLLFLTESLAMMRSGEAPGAASGALPEQDPETKS